MSQIWKHEIFKTMKSRYNGVHDNDLSFTQVGQ